MSIIRKNRHSIKLIRSVLLSMLCILIVCAFMLSYALSTMEKIIISSNADLTASFTENLDIRISEMIRLGETLALSNVNKHLRDLTEKPETIDRQYYKYSMTMRDYLLCNSIISSVFVYYPQIDFVIGNLGCYESSSYFFLQELPNKVNEKYDNWKNLLTENNGNGFFPIQAGDKERLCYIRRTVRNNNLASVEVIELNCEEITRLLNSSRYTGESASAILLAGDIIISAGDTGLLEDIDGFYALWDANPADQIKSNGKYAFFMESDSSNLTYVNVSYAKGILSVWYTIYKLIIVTLTMCVIGSVIVSFWIGHTTAKNTNKILEKVGGSGNSDVSDEYQYISQRIDEMMQEKYNGERKMNEYQLHLDGLFLSTLLYGKFKSESEIISLANHYGVSFSHPNYIIAVFESGDNTTSAIEISHAVSLDNNDNIDCMISFADGYYILLLNTEEMMSTEQIKKIITDMLGNLYPGIPSHAGIGTYTDNTSLIPMSYNYALTALKYSDPSVAHPTNCYNSGLSSESTNKIIQDELISLIRDRNFSEAIKLTEEQQDSAFLPSPVNGSVRSVSAITDALADALSGNPSDTAAEKEIRTLRNDFCRNNVLSVLQLLNGGKNTSCRKESMAEKAKIIIDADYTNPLMGLYYVAEQLGISNSYLSAEFKKSYGVSMIQYINRLRIDMGKELIVNTDRNIKEIALDVGFSSDINFIRVFKKLENCTPSTLRK